MSRLPNFALPRLPSLLPQSDPYAIDPLEEENTLKAVGRTGLAGLGYVGGVLGKLFGGRAIRGGLSALLTGDTGHLRELASIIPGSDTLGITDPNEEVGGRELLQQAGMLGQNRPGLDFGDVAGFAADTLLDPGSYLTFGASALGRGGQVLKRAGVLDDALRGVRATGVGKATARLKTTVGDVLGGLDTAGKEAVETAASKMGTDLGGLAAERVGGNVGIGLPFMRPSFTMGSEKLSGLTDKIGDTLKYGNPLGRSVNSLFNAKAKGATTEIGQKAFEGILSPKTESGTRGVREVAARHVAQAYDADMLGPEGTRSIWSALENPSKSEGLARDISEDWNAIHADQLARKKALHLPASALQDPEMEKGVAPARYSKYGRGAGLGKSRLDHLVGIPGGTNTIRDIVLDEHVQSAVANKAPANRIADLLRTKFPDLPPTYLKRGVAGAEPADRYMALAKHLRKLSPEAMENGLYGHFPVMDQAFRAETIEAHLAKVEASYSILGQHATYTTAADGVPLKNVLKRDTTGMGMGVIAGTSKKPGALDAIAASLGITREQAATLRLKPDVAGDILSQFPGKSAKARPTLGAVGSVMDSFLNLWKAGQTGPWPAFISRNLAGGQIENWTRNMWSASSVWNVGKMLAGKDSDYFTSIPLIQQIAKARGLPLDQKIATNIARELANTYDVSSKNIGEIGARVGLPVEPGRGLSDMLGNFPGGLSGSQPHSLTSTLRTAVGQGEGTLGQKWNPLNVRGVGGKTESTFAPVKAGEEAGAWVEGVNRLSPFFHQLKEGVAPIEAAGKIKATQVAYDAASYTAFERQYLTRLLPFYKYMKSKTIDTARDLITHPGGKQAIGIKGLSRVSEGGEFLPQDVAQGAAISMGQDAEGNPRYLTNLGLMNEQPLSILGGSPWNAQQVGGGLDPLAKLPIETLTGKSLFRQTPMGLKNLDDLDPLIGRTLANLSDQKQPVDVPVALERLAGALPTARALSTLRTLTDPRKRGEYGGPGAASLVNTLTGVRLTDVSPEAKDAVLRDEVKALLKDNRLVHSFENLYVRPEDAANLTPEDRKLMALLRLQAKRKREAKKAG